jgi:hypothetical protein
MKEIIRILGQYIINSMDHGIMTSKFTITKRGQDYGIKLVD